MHPQSTCKSIRCTTQQCILPAATSCILQLQGSSHHHPAWSQHRGMAEPPAAAAQSVLAPPASLLTTTEAPVQVLTAGTAAARVMRSIKSCTNLWQLQQHMEGLDPAVLNSRHLAAALVHAAQLHARQQEQQASVQQPLSCEARSWCLALARQAISPQHLAKHQPRQLSNMLWALACLGLASSQHKTAQENATLVVDTPVASEGTATEGVQSQDLWHVLMAALGRHLQRGQQHRSKQPPRAVQGAVVPLADCVQALHACALAGRSPPAQWLSAALQSMQPQLQEIRSQDASRLAHALAVLRCAVPTNWQVALLTSTQPLLSHMSAGELSCLVWSVPGLLQASTQLQPQLQPQLQLQAPLTRHTATKRRQTAMFTQPHSIQHLLSQKQEQEQLIEQHVGQHIGQHTEQHMEQHIEQPKELAAALQVWKQQVLQQLALRGGLPGAHPAEVAALLWGLAQLQCPPSDVVLAKLLQQASTAQTAVQYSHGISVSHMSSDVSAGHHSTNMSSDIDVSHTSHGMSTVTQFAGLWKQQSGQVPTALASNQSKTTASQTMQQSQWAANVASAVVQLQCSVPPGWLQSAVSVVLQQSRGAQQGTVGTLQDVAGLLSAAARLGQPPEPSVMNAALVTAAHAARTVSSGDHASNASVLSSCTHVVWSLARLRFVPDRRILHDLIAACVAHVSHQQQQQQQQAAQVQNTDTAVRLDADGQLRHLAQLLWSVAVLEQSAQRIAASAAVTRSRQQQSHGLQQQTHGSQQQSHGSQQQSHGSQQQSHGSQQQSHGSQQQSHGSQKQSHGLQQQSHGLQQQSHGLQQQSHGMQQAAGMDPGSPQEKRSAAQLRDQEGGQECLKHANRLAVQPPAQPAPRQAVPPAVQHQRQQQGEQQQEAEQAGTPGTHNIHTSHGAPASSSHAEVLSPADEQRSRRWRQPLLLLHPQLLQLLLQCVTASLASSTQQAPVMAELVWALSQLSSARTLKQPAGTAQPAVPVQLPLELRQQLLHSIALACPQLTLPHFVASMAALPRCGCVRRWDRNNQLLTAACTALLRHLPNMTAHQVRVVLQALSDMGYNLPKTLLTTQLLPELLKHSQLWRPHAAKALLACMPALCKLGLLQLQGASSSSTTGTAAAAGTATGTATGTAAASREPLDVKEHGQVQVQQSKQQGHKQQEDQQQKQEQEMVQQKMPLQQLQGPQQMDGPGVQQQQQQQKGAAGSGRHGRQQQEIMQLVTQLRQAWLRTVLHPLALQGYTTKELTQLLDTCNELGWEPTPRQWRTFYTPSKLHQLLTQCPPQEAVQVLWALASHQACSCHNSFEQQGVRSTRPPQEWVQALAKHVMGDLNVLSGVDVARLICALAYLRYEEPGSNWAMMLTEHLELRSALLKKAEHAAIRDAWVTLGKCRRRGRRHGNP